MPALPCSPALQKASSIAASVLVRAAVDRGSRDNVTVVIVDLSPATQEELDAEAQRSEVGAARVPQECCRFELWVRVRLCLGPVCIWGGSGVYMEAERSVEAGRAPQECCRLDLWRWLLVKLWQKAGLCWTW